MICAYCGEERKGTREHIISKGILDLFPECNLTYDNTKGIVHNAELFIKDVCVECNNKRLSYIDAYAKQFVSKYFLKDYEENAVLDIEYDYAKMQKIFLKYAYNDIRMRKDNADFFDADIISYLLDEENIIPKDNVQIFAGLAVNVTPIPRAWRGNQKIEWTSTPKFLKNSIIRFIDDKTGTVYLSDKFETIDFPELEVAYVFRFNSLQIILLCWNKNKDNINIEGTLFERIYPYTLLSKDGKSKISICTDENNYFNLPMVHVRWDLSNQSGTMRRLASGGSYSYKELYEKEWKKEEEKIAQSRPRK